MGEIAVRLADVVWITADNPRGEPPEIIASEIENGMPKPYRAEVHLQLDRRQAIAGAIARLEPGDALVIAGKGHESYMEADGRRLPWSDADIAVACLHAKNGELKACA
jgi:UDP-N-acetylmuramoyl-L-alanyl-D-glutamate--2,6-diaminopimelate ligase